MIITNKGLSRISRRLINYESTHPDEGTLINLNQVLISDGSIKLVDDSVPVLNHVYSFPTTFISNSASTLVLQVQIDPDVHLNISEIGLYTETETGQELFSIIQGYSLRKEANVGYELLFIINFELSIVNCSIIPKIVVKDNPPIPFGIFESLKQVHLNTLSDLERIVQKNADELGYAKELYFNNLELNRYTWLQNSEATLDYLSLRNLKFSNKAIIKDFFNIPDIPYNYFIVRNLNNVLNSNIEVFGNIFKGTTDSIDFSDIRGFSTSFALNIPDLEDRFILGKVNTNNNDKYFTLAFLDKSFVFTIYGNDGESSVTLKVSSRNIKSFFIGKPFLLTVVSYRAQDFTYFNLYLDSTLVSTKRALNFPFFTNPQDFSIVNFIENESIYGNKEVISNIISFSKRVYTSDINKVKNLIVPNA